MNGQEKIIEEKIKQNLFKNRSLILPLMLILGIIILIALYLHFEFTYQFSGINKQIEKLDSNQTELKSFSEKLIVSNNIAPQVIVPETHEEKHLPVVALNPEGNCRYFLYFIRDYYQMRLAAERGKDFPNELLKLNNYTINSTEITHSITTLANLVAQNVENQYFRIKFNHLIKDLYRTDLNSSAAWYYQLINRFKQLVLIRTIGDRALREGGVDMEVLLIEEALDQNDFTAAYTHIQNLSGNLKLLKELEVKLQSKIIMEETFVTLDKLLLNETDCKIVSK